MQVTEHSFLEDIANYSMTVLADNELNRHLRFQKPGTMLEHFDLLTWPGYLCFTGDMGTFVFRRLPDMFHFFRTKPDATCQLPVNPQYWSQKLESVDRDGFEQYSPEKFVQAVQDWLDDGEASPEMREAVAADVLKYAEHGEARAVSAAMEFTHEGETVFQDFYEVRLRTYTQRFLWCCHAIVWSIQQYDNARAMSAEPA